MPILQSRRKYFNSIFEKTSLTKERIEKDFLIDFLSQLPLETLKDICNFKEIDTSVNSKTIAINPEDYDWFIRLKREQQSELMASIEIKEPASNYLVRRVFLF